jgi:very-short-patch-repair endonuclease
VEELAVPGRVEGFPARRVGLVNRAVKQWREALIDRGGRNNLIHYRDLKQGTLDLTSAAPGPFETLMQGRPTRISSLFPAPEERAEVLRRVRTIANKARENLEERGLDTLAMASGMATWNNENIATWAPAAPVLVRQASLRALGSAQDDFELQLVDEMEVNPTLLHFLKVNFKCEIDPEDVIDHVDRTVDEPWELLNAYERIADQAQRVPGFTVEPRVVLGNFSYAKLPMVRDLESAFEQLVAHDLIAAIAGDEEAREAVRAASPDPGSIPSPDAVPPSDEFLILDADSSQNYAINAVLAGESLIVRGPPGTGKSQTIANLIGSLVSRNKRVLFVAEKRAAIEAVTKRMHQRGLGDLVLDLHGGVGSRRVFAQQIGSALAAMRTVPPVDRSAEQRLLEVRRGELNRYVRSLHEKREPWGLSVYELRARVVQLRTIEPVLRFRGEVLRSLAGEKLERVEEELRQFARLRGFSLPSSDSPWASAAISDESGSRDAYELVERLSSETFPQAVQSLATAAAETGLPLPADVAAWDNRVILWEAVARTLATFSPAVYEQDLDTISARMAPARAGWFQRIKAALFSPEYREARSALRALCSGGLPSDRALGSQVEEARQQIGRWEELGGNGSPRSPANLSALVESYERLEVELRQLGDVLGKPVDLLNQDRAKLEDLLSRLVKDRPTLVTLPEMHRLRESLRSAGLTAFLAEMEDAGASERRAMDTLRYAWCRSILDHLAFVDPLIEGFDAERHERTVDDFRDGDREHIEDAAGRIRRISAEQATAVRDNFRDQEAVLKKQAALKRRHLPVRDLIRGSSDVLLALKPCWAMSPLVVSQLLPAETMFDVVVFDEASQVTPADAATSILRGRQLVVAGDEKQLPPTAFFASDSLDEGEDEEGEELVDLAVTSGFESVLDALGVMLPFRMLRWHYRSRDERLIAFSNAHIYDRQLVTFPGPGSEPFRLVTVPHAKGADTNSPGPEVEAVIDLVIEHAMNSPEKSLGVIAMGIRHAIRIEEAFRQRLRANPSLERSLGDFFAEDREERFFVKNLERVQGDERDSIILSVGYGKDDRGNVPLRWGPILGQGGERRLNVAVTRAKRDLTLVASFAARDLDPSRSQNPGFHFVRRYLQFVESGGQNLGDVLAEKPALNPFEADVRNALVSRGLNVVPQYGASGYWIDFAVAHPEEPGRFILAIECDGASYHSSQSARDRDRLRQDQLERLGWKFHRIWSTEWFHDKQKALDAAVAAYQAALAQAAEPSARLMTVASNPPAPEIRGQAVLPAKFEPSSARGSRPHVPQYQPINEYRQSDFVRMVRWIESDHHLRTEEELLAELMLELGFRRRGARIVEALTAAIRRARSKTPP